MPCPASCPLILSGGVKIGRAVSVCQHAASASGNGTTMSMQPLQVEKKFPNKEAPLLVACGNGRQYSIDALDLLDEAGYINLAGLKGGYNAWFGTFDSKGNRRKSGEYQEEYGHDGDSAGIHGSGAGFPKMDPADKWVPQEY